MERTRVVQLERYMHEPLTEMILVVPEDFDVEAAIKAQFPDLGKETCHSVPVMEWLEQQSWYHEYQVDYDVIWLGH